MIMDMCCSLRRKKKRLESSTHCQDLTYVSSSMDVDACCPLHHTQSFSCAVEPDKVTLGSFEASSQLPLYASAGMLDLVDP